MLALVKRNKIGAFLLLSSLFWSSLNGQQLDIPISMDAAFSMVDTHPLLRQPLQIVPATAASPIPSLKDVFQPQPTTPSVYAYRELAFFCKIEVQLEKASRFPVKFRLGDVQYVDKLEGKRE